MPYTAPKGTQDILPAEAKRWQWLEDSFRHICTCYGYAEIRTPIFEDTALFSRSVGEETDIVSKQMYSFTSRGGDALTLRPEGTASVVRALIQHNLLAQQSLQKLYYMGPIFRYERPQKGRYRQFHQIGAEVFGSEGPEIDAEILALAAGFLNKIGISGTTLELNSVGCPACRPQYREALRVALATVQGELCGDCQRRYDTNPLRILDCKVPRCAELTVNAPVILDVICDECRSHLQGVEDGLATMGVAYQLNPHIVRGLDYYTRTAFEFIAGGLGSQNTVLAGGRYDGLVKELGGASTPAIGFAAGEERLLLSLGDSAKLPADLPTIYLASLGDKAKKYAVEIAVKLRAAGVSVNKDYAGRSLKAQMKEAGRLQASFVVILGDDEISRGNVVVRDMQTAAQEEIVLTNLVDDLSARLEQACTKGLE